MQLVVAELVAAIRMKPEAEFAQQAAIVACLHHQGLADQGGLLCHRMGMAPDDGGKVRHFLGQSQVRLITQMA